MRDVFRGATGKQDGDGNVQINIHENRTGIVAACVVALVFGATLAVVLVTGKEPGDKEVPPPTGTPFTASGTSLAGRLVNDGSGLCLRAPGTADGVVPVLAPCTDAPDRAWSLPARHEGSTARALRNDRSGRCLTVIGAENSAPVPQRRCTTRADAHWEVLWGTGDRAGHFMLRSTANAKCLVAQGAEVNRPVGQISCGEQYDDQWWYVGR